MHWFPATPDPQPQSLSFPGIRSALKGQAQGKESWLPSASLWEPSAAGPLLFLSFCTTFLQVRRRAFAAAAPAKCMESRQQKGGRDLTPATAAHPPRPPSRSLQRVWTPGAPFGRKILHLAETNHLSRHREGTPRMASAAPAEESEPGAKLWPRDGEVRGLDSRQFL